VTRRACQVIQIDEAWIGDHLRELVRGTVEETLKRCWMPKLTSYAAQGAMSVTKLDSIRARAAMSGRCTRRRATSASRFRNCGVRRLRRQLLSAIAGRRAQSRKR
jgi:hypothetical protein